MALRFDANGDYLTRTANLPSSTAFTLCGWAKIVGSGAGSNEILASATDAAASAGYALYSRVGGTYGLSIYNPDAGAPVNAGSLSTGQWYFVALSCAGTGATDAKARFAAPGATSFTTASVVGSSTTIQKVGVGESLGLGQWSNVAVAGWKLFDRALTDAELLAEMNRLAPASTTNLNVWTPMVHDTVANAVKDLSGNGRDWTANGTLTIEDGPPVGWGGQVAIVGQAASGPSAQAIDPTGIASNAAFGASTVAKVAARTLAPGGLASSAAFGSATVANVSARSVQPLGVSSAAAFGATTVANVAAVDIAPSGIASPAAFGAAAVTLGSGKTVVASGLGSSVAFGSSLIAKATPQAITVPGIASVAAIGSATVAKVAARTISASGVASVAAIGTATVANVTAQVIAPSGIPTSARFGSSLIEGGGAPSVVRAWLRRIGISIGIGL